MRALDNTIEGLRSRIQEMVGRLGPAVAPSAGDDAGFVLPLSQASDLSGAYARVMMDLKVYETKYGILASKLEQTKIEESQSVPTFEVLDRAERPYRKSAPRRSLMVLAAFLGGSLAGVLLAVLLEELDRRVDDQARRELRGMLPSAWRGSRG
jgi:capsule polysaccharide export protein KpsE/RkpR